MNRSPAAVSTTLLVFAPSCSTRIIAQHISASRHAGNAVQVALFEPAEPLLRILLLIFADLMPGRFTVLSEGSGWEPGAVEKALVVVTETDAFLNSAPWIHVHLTASGDSSRELVEFYSIDLALSSGAERASR